MEKDAIRTIYSTNNRSWCIMRFHINNLIRSTTHNKIAKSLEKSGLMAFQVYVSLVMAFTLSLTFVAYPQIAVSDSRLIMVTSDNCPYCYAWELDVGEVYDKSPYAPSLPLTRIDIGSKMPKDVTFQKPVVGTPTFLVIHNGQEIGRQSGYIDAEMFWWWLSEYAAQ